MCKSRRYRFEEEGDRTSIRISKIAAHIWQRGRMMAADRSVWACPSGNCTSHREGQCCPERSVRSWGGYGSVPNER
eukprot:350436-Chlamydomonas_euryale.AAC.23